MPYDPHPRLGAGVSHGNPQRSVKLRRRVIRSHPLEVIGAAYASFHDGLHAALYVSAGLALAAGLLAFFTLRSRPAAAETLTFPLRPSDRDSGQP